MSTGYTSRERVIELRQYTLHPGRRDELITLFEQSLLVPQNGVGARVLGQFRDLDDPDRFVWLRGFDSMTARHVALTTFYEGPAWRAHRNEANATMRDSDNVLLLSPFAASSSSTFDEQGTAERSSTYFVVIHDLRSVDPAAFAAHYVAVELPLLQEQGARTSKLFATELALNTFDRLPVRTNESVLVCVSRFDDVDAIDRVVSRMRRWNPLRDQAPDALLPAFMRRPEILRLAPTEASAMR
jgi:hypothetical protein